MEKEDTDTNMKNMEKSEGYTKVYFTFAKMLHTDLFVITYSEQMFNEARTTSPKQMTDMTINLFLTREDVLHLRDVIDKELEK